MKVETPPEQAPEKPSEGRERLRVGLVATDALRVLGLRAIVEGALFRNASFGESVGTEIVPLSIPGVLNDADLSIIIIDASCTDHLLELLQTFRRMKPHVRLIVLGDTMERDYIQQVIGAGARGYLPHTADEGEIRMALEVVHDGSVWAPRKVLARLLDNPPRSSGGRRRDTLHFTPREVEVLRLLVTGMGNREIATELSLNESTIKAHLSRLMRKVGATNRIELTVKALADWLAS